MGPSLRPSAQGSRWHAAAIRFAAAFARGSLRCGDMFLLWLERMRQRRALASLSDHVLKDLGLSHTDVELESAKRFWED